MVEETEESVIAAPTPIKFIPSARALMKKPIESIPFSLEESIEEGSDQEKEAIEEQVSESPKKTSKRKKTHTSLKEVQTEEHVHKKKKSKKIVE
jgi:hypothetical protein